MKKITILHSNDLHGDFFSESTSTKYRKGLIIRYNNSSTSHISQEDKIGEE